MRDLQNRIIKQEEIKAPTAEDLEVFRNQLRMQVEGEVDMDTGKSVLNSLIKNRECSIILSEDLGRSQRMP